MLSRKAKRVLIVVSGIALTGCFVLFIWLVLMVVGLETRTTNPSEEQVAYSRDFLYINPLLNIQPKAYYIKDGMDYQVRFKFISMTSDPTQIFNNDQVDPSEFKTNYEFPQGEASHNEVWWDIASRKLTGGNFWVPKEAERFWRLSVGFLKNDDGTLTVYTWRHETGISLRE